MCLEAPIADVLPPDIAVGSSFGVIPWWGTLLAVIVSFLASFRWRLLMLHHCLECVCESTGLVFDSVAPVLPPDIAVGSGFGMVPWWGTLLTVFVFISYKHQMEFADAAPLLGVCV